MDLDLRLETTRKNLCVVHVGYRDGELRLMLAAAPGGMPSLVVELREIHSFFDHGAVGCGWVDAVVTEPGSFGWYLSQKQRARYKEVRLNSKSDPIDNVFRAITRTVVTRHAKAEDVNYPA